MRAQNKNRRAQQAAPLRETIKGKRIDQKEGVADGCSVGTIHAMPLQKELPEGWGWKTLGEIAEVVGGGTPRTNVSDYFNNGKIPWLTPADLSGYQNKFICHGERFITEEGLKNSSARMMPAGTVLFTSRAPIGYVAIASNPVCTNQGFKSFVLKDGVLSDYVYWYLKGSKNLAESLASGTTFLELTAAKAKQVPIPLAPIDQQTLIVSEIEKQFSRLDEAMAALKRVRAGLKRYKASVLKAAVEGRLTEEWRKQNPNVEPADKLRKRILAERKKKWEEAYPKKKYKEPAAPDTSNLPALPKGWVSATWEMILAQEEGAFRRGPFGSTLKKSMFVEAGYKVYEQYCPINDDPSFARYFITEKKYKEMEQFVVKARDFLISCSGTMGRITQVPDEYDKGVINQALLRVRINNNIINGVFFKMLFISPYFQKQIFDNSTGSAIQNVKGVNELKVIPLPLPPLEEQKAIIEKIDRGMSVIHEIDKEIDINLKRAERLRQAILKKAFSGRLV